MDLLKLQYFKTVAETENLTRAAKLLYVTQPNLSVSITRLEEELGVALFQRRRGKITLTPNGKMFLKYVDQVFQSLDDGIQAVRSAESANAQYIRIASSTPDFIGDLLTQFYAVHPEVRIEEIICTNAQVPQLVENDTADIGFVFGVPVSDKLEFIGVDSCVRVAVVAAGHPLAGAGEISLAQLRGERFICSESRNDGEVLDSFGELAGFEPEIWYKCSNNELECRLIQSGAGVSVMPVTNYLKLMRSDPDAGIAALRIREPLDEVRIGMVRRRECALSDNELEFLRQVDAFFQEENRHTLLFLERKSRQKEL